MGWLQRRWFLVGLIVLIPAGLAIGAALPADRLGPITQFAKSGATSWVVAAILFLMSFSLDSRQIGHSLKRPGPVLFACLVNLGVAPLIAWPLMYWQLLPDYAVGLMIVASVPCTLAAASVWTRKGGGNDAVSLLVTLVTNGICFLVTPLWLNVIESSDVAFDAIDMMRRLLLTALLPATAGQLARLIPGLQTLARQRKTEVGVMAQIFIMGVIFSAATLEMGPHLRQMELGSGGLLALGVVWISCIVVHVSTLWIGWHSGRRLGFDRADCIAIAFSGSQKTLPIGLLVATHPAMFGNGSVPFALFPVLIYHASQLFIDTAVADGMQNASRRAVEVSPPRFEG